MSTQIQTAGKVDIQEITLVSGGGVFVSLISFLIELNLYEDIYAGGLYGNIVLSDSVGLVHKMNIVGEEYITIKIDTPGFNTPIWKSFRCCSVQNRVFTKDTTTESYVIHFISPEIYMDHYMPVQRAFEGTAEDIVEEIYTKYIKHPRYMEVKDDVIVESEESTELCIFTECKNKIKFISPTWSPMKCLSWVASKVVSSRPELPAANFMFFETNKRFYWGSIENIIQEQRDANAVSGVYFYTPGNTKNDTGGSADSKKYKSPDLLKDFFSVHNLTVMNNVDSLNNMQTGYTSSVFHELDIGTRTYTENIYDHATQYPFYNHTSTDAKGFFSLEAPRVPYTHQIIGFKHTGLFDNIPNNLNETAKSTQPIRNSLMAEMNQVKMKLEVHGRSDVELASLIYLVYPKSGPKTEDDSTKNVEDPQYSGLCIITAIHHSITLETHTMAMEVIKDSFGDIGSSNSTN